MKQSTKLKDEFLTSIPEEDTYISPIPDISKLEEADLLKLRNNIDKLLNISLSALDMENELAIQLKHAKALYNNILTNEKDDTPTNQKAQVLNTISSIIASISKTITEVYSAARLKKIEAAVLAAVTSLDTDAKTKFFDLYGEYLGL